MARSPALIERLVAIAQAAQAAGHGGKEAIYQGAMNELGMSRATLLRAIKEVTVKPERKRRNDAGKVLLPRPEAVKISAYLMETMRKNNKRLAAVGQVLEVLRNNGEIKAERLDEKTGEFIQLSDSAVSRALRSYGLHPDQLLRPTPAVEMKSPHPNWCWQIDASMCVLYYMNSRNPREQGLQVMEAKKFYKNKPANLKRIESDRVWSYEVTDHNSGAIFVHYVTGAESAANLAEAFIAAIQYRDLPFHGVPYYLMMDPGSANTSGAFKTLARRLQVNLLVHAPGNARATGQVENARNLIERSFESGLRFKPVANIDELNQLAGQWAKWYNGTKVHSRHGKTRFEQWLTITEQQLRIAPPVALCRELLTHEPKTPKVSDFLTVQFHGAEYDVSSIPNVMIGEKLKVTYNPYNLDAALVVDSDKDGNEILYPIPRVQRDESGFREDAPTVALEFKAPAETVLDRNRKEVQCAAMDVTTIGEAEQAKKDKAIPFGGRIDPFKVAADVQLPTYMPRRGIELEVAVKLAQQQERILTHYQAAAELVRLGVAMDKEKNRLVSTLYPEGVPESEISNLQARLTVRSSLRLVNGD
jgi:transposase InsO family protein